MEQRTLGRLAEYLKINTTSPDTIVSGVEKDNRRIKKGDLFVAICGENFDGHDFAVSAARAGAAAALVSKEVEGLKIPCLMVEDTVAALGKIAAAYRSEFSIPVVGVTGSVGKTTTKEMIASVLSQKYNTLKTMGNLNNEIGLPFTIIDLDSSHQAAVVEMGMNHFGEISRLTKIAQPNIAVISTIGESHIEFLGSKAGILKAKLEILEGLSEGGTVVLNGDDEYLWGVRGKLPFRTIYYGIENPEVDIFGIAEEDDLSGISFALRGENGRKFRINVGGSHNLQNALAAIAVGRELKLSDDEIASGLDAFENTGMRQKILEIGSQRIINDCYNANPDSMRAALKLLKNVTGRRVAVLADMLELGEISENAHFEIGKVAKDSADLIFVTGNMKDVYARGADGASVYTFDTAEELAKELKEQLEPGDTVLVKASRGMKLERVVEKLFE